ncbi:MAG: RidA family protein [Thermoplasmatota archaeon]
MAAEANLQKLGISLPTPARPVAAYVPTVRTGNLVYVAGQVPMREGKLAITGRVGAAGISLEAAQGEARQCALNALAALRAEVASLDKVRRIVRVGVFVAAVDSFQDHAKVANGASELFQQIFGEAGVHARTTIGVPGLPLGAVVEVEIIAEINP